MGNVGNIVIILMKTKITHFLPKESDKIANENITKMATLTRIYSNKVSQ